MHYSMYLRGIKKPVVTEPEQKPVETKVETAVEPLKTVPEVDPSKFKTLDPNNIPDTMFANLCVSQEKAQVVTHPETQRSVDPTVEKLVKLLSDTQDIVTKGKMNKLLDVMFEGLEETIHENATLLDEYEADRIGQFFIDVSDKYFDDIGFESLPKAFIWNIPRTMYEDMCKAQDDGVPDILNPMIYLYIALSGEPGLAAARFMKILSELRYDNTSAFNEADDRYQALLDAEYGEDEEDPEESISATFIKNGYTAEDEDS